MPSCIYFTATIDITNNNKALMEVLMPLSVHNLIVIFALLLSTGFHTVSADELPELRFAPLPLEDRKIIHEQFQGFTNYLSNTVKQQFNWVYLSDYADIIEQFSQERIDLAYLGPLPYVILKRKFPDAEPLACFREADGSPSYTCSLVTYGGSELALKDLKGVHIGLTQPYSTCGYLAVTQMLGPAGLSLDRDGNHFTYAGSHSAAALGVAQGKYDAAGVKTVIAERYAHLDLERIATSSHFPGFTLVANSRTLSPDTIAALRKALLALDPSGNPAHKKLMASWGKHIRSGAVPAEQCDYSGVDGTLDSLPWPIPGSQP
jgi:phosphonate transport system substrate-binding protein